MAARLGGIDGEDPRGLDESGARRKPGDRDCRVAQFAVAAARGGQSAAERPPGRARAGVGRCGEGRRAVGRRRRDVEREAPRVDVAIRVVDDVNQLAAAGDGRRPAERARRAVELDPRHGAQRVLQRRVATGRRGQHHRHLDPFHRVDVLRRSAEDGLGILVIGVRLRRPAGRLGNHHLAADRGLVAVRIGGRIGDVERAGPHRSAADPAPVGRGRQARRAAQAVRERRIAAARDGNGGREGLARDQAVEVAEDLISEARLEIGRGGAAHRDREGQRIGGPFVVRSLVGHAVGARLVRGAGVCPGGGVEAHAGDVRSQRIGDRAGAAGGSRIRVGSGAAGRVAAVRGAGRSGEARPGRIARDDLERERIGIAVVVRHGVDHAVAAGIRRRAAQRAGVGVELHARNVGRERVEQPAVAAGRQRQRDPPGVARREREAERDLRELRLAVRLARDLNREADAGPVAVDIGRAVAHAEAARSGRRAADGPCGPVEADPGDGRVEVVAERRVAAGRRRERDRRDRDADGPSLRSDQLRAERGPRVRAAGLAGRRARRGLHDDGEGRVGGRAGGVGRGVEDQVPPGRCGRAAQRAGVAVEAEPADAVDQVVAQRPAPAAGCRQDDRIDLRAAAESPVGRLGRECERGDVRFIAARRRRLPVIAVPLIGRRAGSGLLIAAIARARAAGIRLLRFLFAGQGHCRERDPPPLEQAPVRRGRVSNRRQQDLVVVDDGEFVALRRVALHRLEPDRRPQVAVDAVDLDAGTAQPLARPTSRRLRGQEPQRRQVAGVPVDQRQLDPALAERHPQLDRNFARDRGLLGQRRPRRSDGE